MSKKILFVYVILILLLAGTVYSQYDPPIGRTTYYFLRMWGEGDRPGADSVNRNLIDIDLYLHNLNTHITNVESNLSTTNTYVLQHFITVNDSLAAHRLIYNSLRVEFDNVASIVSSLEDTLSSRVPRLSLANAFTGNNSFTNITIKDNGTNSLLLFNPASQHTAIIKSNNDTLLVASENSTTAYGTWKFKSIMENNITGHLISPFGNTVETGLWVATEQNGQATTQLRAVPITINGVTVYILYFNPQ